MDAYGPYVELVGKKTKDKIESEITTRTSTLNLYNFFMTLIKTCWLCKLIDSYINQMEKMKQEVQTMSEYEDNKKMQLI